jgi:hypothetical protein
MTHGVIRTIRKLLPGVMLFALPVHSWSQSPPPPAPAGTLYVANNGIDGALCGGRIGCRSISQAIENAAPKTPHSWCRSARCP